MRLGSLIFAIGSCEERDRDVMSVPQSSGFSETWSCHHLLLGENPAEVTKKIRKSNLAYEPEP
jgi:hypothetical protein